MVWTHSKRHCRTRNLLAAALMTFAVVAAAETVAADTTRQGASLVGAWFNTVTPTLLPPFVGIGNFTADGGVINTTSLSLGQPLESPGHGQWVRVGRDLYAVTFLTVSSDAAGNHILTSKVRARIQVNGDTFIGVFQVDVFDPGGGLLVSDTGTVTGARIKVEPLPEPLEVLRSHADVLSAPPRRAATATTR